MLRSDFKITLLSITQKSFLGVYLLRAILFAFCCQNLPLVVDHLEENNMEHRYIICATSYASKYIYIYSI